MPTYLYVVKNTLRHIEDDSGKITKLGQLTVKDYVAALRKGPGYGTEPHDLSGNITTLRRFAAAYGGDRLTLDLNVPGGTMYAITAFGAVDGGKIYQSLEADDTWKRIEVLRAGRDRVKLMVADGKFGTPHDKMLALIASEHFPFPSGMKEVFMPSLFARQSASDFTLYFRSFK